MQVWMCDATLVLIMPHIFTISTNNWIPSNDHLLYLQVNY